MTELFLLFRDALLAVLMSWLGIGDSGEQPPPQDEGSSTIVATSSVRF